MQPNLRRLIPAATTAAVALASIASAADAALQWKFTVGDKADYVIERKQDRAIDLGGNQLEIGSGSTLDIQWTVESVDPSGTATLKAKVERLQIELNSPIAQFSYDSTGEEPEGDAIWEEIGDRIKKFVGSEVTIVVRATGKVEKVEFAPDVVEALKKEYSNPQIGRFMGSQFDEKGLSKFVNECFTPLPKANPMVGESWEETETTVIPRLGEAVVKRSFKYSGKAGEGGMEQIEVTSKVEFKASEGGEEESSVELAEQDGKGTIEFDAGSGRCVKSEFVQKMKMNLSRDGNDVSIDSKETTKLWQGKSEPRKTEEPKDEDKETKGDADEDK